MNRIYRLVWSRCHACWMVVSELARSQCARSTTGVGARSEGNVRARSDAGTGAWAVDRNCLSGGTQDPSCSALNFRALTPAPSALYPWLADSISLSLGLCFMLCLPAHAAPPTATPTSDNTRSYLAPNGTTVVEIAVPNGAGVSNNQYSRYDVNAQGLILNNANASQAVRQSSLAGPVAANARLSSEARIILNQVVGANRSTLNGFTEVLGQRADVVVANPYGITCGGCGFLNSDRVTLTTGLPVWGGNGSLAGFDVTQGDILINGAGLNASAQQILDLVSRSAVIDGKINAVELGIHAGANEWSYSARAVTAASAPAGSAPIFAIDTSALGGMYANRIFLISTDAGVGVRLLGNAAAGNGDFTLAANGKVSIQGKLSAGRDLTVSGDAPGDLAGMAAAGATDREKQAIQLTNASLSAGRDLELMAYGALNMRGSIVVAERDMSVGAASFSDTVAGQPGGNPLTSGGDALSSNNDLYARHNLSALILGTSSMQGSGWGAGNDLWARYGSLEVQAQGARFHAGRNLSMSADSGDLALGKSQVLSGVDLALSAEGAISTLASVEQSVLAITGNLAVSAGKGLSNAGTLAAQGGSAVLQVDGDVVNTGEISARADLDLGRATGAGSMNLHNLAGGRLLTDGLLTLQGASLENQAGARVQAAITRLGGATLDNAGDWLLSGSDGGFADTVSISGAFRNSGTLQSARSLVLTAQGVENSGRLLAAAALDMRSKGGFITRENSITQAGQALTLAASTLQNAGSFKAATLALDTSGEQGMVNSGVLQADSGLARLRVTKLLENSGRIHASGTLDIADANGTARLDILNSGTGELTADDGFLVKAGVLRNDSAARIQASQGSVLQLGSLANDGTMLLSTTAGADDRFVLSGMLANHGILQSARSFAIAADNVINGGSIMAGGDLYATVNQFYTGTAQGILQADRDLLVNAGSVNNGGTVKAASVAFTAEHGMGNDGTVQADAGKVTVRAGEFFNNLGMVRGASGLDIADAEGKAGARLTNKGQLHSGATLSMSGTEFLNEAGAWIQARSGSQIELGTLVNRGTMLLSEAGGLTDSAAAEIDSISANNIFSNAGTLQSARTLTLASPTLDNDGRLIAGGNLGLDLAGTLKNRRGALIQAGQTLRAGGISVLTNDAQSDILADRLLLSAAELDNAGTIQGDSSTNSLVVVSNGLINRSDAVLNLAASTAGAGTLSANSIHNAGTLQSNGNLSLQVGGGNLYNNGRLLAGAMLTGGGRNNGGFDITIDGSGIIQAGELKLAANKVTLAGQASLQSLQGMNLDLGSLTFSDSSARVFAASSGNGSGTINLREALYNSGGIYSGHDLGVSAPAVTVTETGGIAALHDLSLISRTGNLDNSGSLYAANHLALAAGAGIITNVGNLAGAIGTLDAGRSMSLGARAIVNNSVIRSDGDITLAAATIRNEPLGGDTRLWSTPQEVEERLVGHLDKGYNGCNCADMTEIYYYEKTWNQQQRYAAAYPVINGQARPPQARLLAGGTLTLREFDSASNLASLMSAPTVNLVGKSGATFRNDDLALEQHEFRQTYQRYIKYVAAGPGVYTDDRNHDDSGPVRTGAITLFSPGSGIYADTINGGGFTLVNKGSPFAPGTSPDEVKTSTATLAVAETDARPTASISYAGAAGGSGARPIAYHGVAAAVPLGTITFNGLRLTLPASPNGFFVPASAPDANYLIVRNGALGDLPAAFQGTDRLLRELGFDPDVTQRRLGDASYEAWLIEQQVLDTTRRTVLDDYADQTAMLTSLVDNAVSQSRSLGLKIGQAPTAQQLAGLTQDMVWLVETRVGDETVLAPQVYLADATRRSIVSGAVLAADRVKLDLVAVDNTGGEIRGATSLELGTRGDLVNTSGVLGGGTVSLQSSQGNIVNQTLAELDTGSSTQLAATTLGRQASIESDGDIKLKAGGDIRNLGAQLDAGGNASLSASGSVLFDTVEDRAVRRNHGEVEPAPAVAGAAANADDAKDGGAADTGAAASATDGTAARTPFDTSAGTGSFTTTNTTTARQLRSRLSTGGSLTIDTGVDIGLAGTDVLVSGDATLAAGGGIGLLARADSTSVHTDSKLSGLGVGGGIYGTVSKVTDEVSLRNVGSSMVVGGQASLKAGKDVTLQGSSLEMEGDTSITGASVNVVAGLDSDTIHSVTDSQTFGRTSKSGTAEASASATAAGAASNDKRTAKAEGEAEARASAQATGEAGLHLADISHSDTQTQDYRHVASTLSSGGRLSIDAGKDVNVAGSSVTAEGDLSIKAQNVNVRAVADGVTTVTSTSTTSYGLMGKSDNLASAEASASGKADSGGAGKINAQAGRAAAEGAASAEAQASSSNDLTLLSTTTGTQTSLDITHKAASISSGGDLDIVATGKLATEGSALSAQGDLTLAGDEMSFKAVQDRKESGSTSTTTRVGMYGDTGVEAETSVGASAKGANMAGSIKGAASASAKAGAGLKVDTIEKNTVEKSGTAVVSTLSAGSNLNRQAAAGIGDTGTQITAGKDFRQSASTISSVAAENSTSSSSDSTSHAAQVGVVATAEAEVQLKLNASAGIGAGGLDGTFQKLQANQAGAGVGVEAQYKYEQSKASTATTEAVVSTIKAGGNVGSSSTGATTLQGSVIESGGNVDLAAGSLAFQAASDSSTSTDSSTKGSGKVQLTNDANNFSAGGAYELETNSESSTTARVGEITSAGALRISTSGDSVFEGSKLTSGEATALSSGGDLRFDAARDTSSNGKEGIKAALDIGSTVEKADSNSMLNAEGGYSKSSGSGSTAVAGSVSSGAGLSIESGKNATLVGTRLDSTGDMRLSATGDLVLETARSSQSSESFALKAGLGEMQEKKVEDDKEKEAGMRNASLGGNYLRSSSDTAEAATLSSGGDLKLSSGRDTSLVGTTLDAAGQTSIQGGRDVKVAAAISSESEIGFGASVSLIKKEQTERAAGGSGGGSAAGADTSVPAAGAGKSTSGAADRSDKSGTGNKGDKGGKADQADTDASQSDSKSANVFNASGNYVNLQGSKSSTASVASLGGGRGLSITSGGTTALDGSRLASGGDIRVDAGGDVTFGTANSSSLSGGAGANFSNGGPLLNQAQLGVGDRKQGVTVENAGDLSISSGGTVRLAGSKAKSDGNISVTGKAGVQKEDTTSGGMEIGLTNIHPEYKVQQTELQGAGRTLVLADGQRRFTAALPAQALSGQAGGSKLVASTSDGKPLPTWLKFDASTGKFSGTPPADFTGTVKVDVRVPQKDGSTMQVPLTFSAP